ncbi:hypothetical protein GCM10025857_38530 [Alicyclobacillus contaminans]|uniref:hypothetical protein n=1 Tax=Alicyclobacillus contaminans TaxID=392016 RepID=UPI00040885ED|nr:hypothetical protein [Alicyclobacillus contaminans]GMA52496.1 hypothetical protein GCM10025857_38530 [Alicyclobacillus contaminans]
MDIGIEKVYVLHVEEENDFLFTPVGLVIVLENRHYSLYTIKSEHNRYRNAIAKHAWKDLENGVQFKGASYRLEDVTPSMREQGWTGASAIPAILGHFYKTKTKYFYFLQTYFS